MLSDIQSVGKSQPPYDVSHTWDVKLKPINQQARQTQTHWQRQQYGGYQREGKWGERQERVRGDQIYGDGDDLTLDGEHTVQYTDDIYQIGPKVHFSRKMAPVVFSCL